MTYSDIVKQRKKEVKMKVHLNRYDISPEGSGIDNESTQSVQQRSGKPDGSPLMGLFLHFLYYVK